MAKTATFNKEFIEKVKKILFKKKPKWWIYYKIPQLRRYRRWKRGRSSWVCHQHLPWGKFREKFSRCRKSTGKDSQRHIWHLQILQETNWRKTPFGTTGLKRLCGMQKSHSPRNLIIIMNSRAHLLLITIVSGFFLFLDQLLKYLSLRSWTDIYLLNHFLGWQPSLNDGIAFSLPMPLMLSIFLTIPIIAIILYLFNKHSDQFPLNFALLLILSGALSNLFDRIVYNHTVDYFLILTAVINIADVMIVSGFAIYLLSKKKETSQ